MYWFVHEFHALVTLSFIIHEVGKLFLLPEVLMNGVAGQGHGPWSEADFHVVFTE